MKKIFGLLFLTIMLVNFTACSNDDDTTAVPECHEQIIEDFRAIACPGTGDLTTWDFDGELVYCYATGSCIADAFAEIYDADCNLLCTLGGINGLSTCQGLDWNSNATPEGTIIRY